MVYNSDWRSINKENPSVEEFLGGYNCGLLTHISGQHRARKSRIHSIRSLDNLAFEIWTRNMSSFCGWCSIVEWDECQLSKWVDTWHLVIIGTVISVVSEINPLEENQTEISMYYDHILYLIQPSTNFFNKVFITSFIMPYFSLLLHAPPLLAYAMYTSYFIF